jgi:hypothetical protein
MYPFLQYLGTDRVKAYLDLIERAIQSSTSFSKKVREILRKDYGGSDDSLSA